MCTLRRARARRRTDPSSVDEDGAGSEERMPSGASQRSVGSCSAPLTLYGASTSAHASLVDVPLIPGLTLPKNDKVLLWHFPFHVSQTRLGARKKPSSACSLIAVRLAELVFRQGIQLPVWRNDVFLDTDGASGCARYFAPDKHGRRLLPQRLFFAMANAIVDGNMRADSAMATRSSDLFNVPTAIELMGGHFGEVSFVTSKSREGNAFLLLYGHLKSAIDHELTAEWKQMFFMLMFMERCVLVVYQRDVDSVAILDSHTHRHFGAMMAVASSRSLPEFCAVVLKKFFPETAGKAPYELKFELSLLYFRSSLQSEDCPVDEEALERVAMQVQPVRKRVFSNYDKCVARFMAAKLQLRRPPTQRTVAGHDS